MGRMKEDVLLHTRTYVSLRRDGGAGAKGLDLRGRFVPWKWGRVTHCVSNGIMGPWKPHPSTDAAARCHPYDPRRSCLFSGSICIPCGLCISWKDGTIDLGQVDADVGSRRASASGRRSDTSRQFNRRLRPLLSAAAAAFSMGRSSLSLSLSLPAMDDYRGMQYSFCLSLVRCAQNKFLGQLPQ
jgi:hypothetical protein